MMIIKTSNSCGSHIAGFQCDTCKKTEITGDFLGTWFRDDTEYDLALKKITETITKINEDIKEEFLGKERN